MAASPQYLANLEILRRRSHINLDNLIDELHRTHETKNAGYAGKDNPDTFANFRLSENFGVSAANGALVRLSDKYARVVNLTANADNEQVGESRRDTLIDLSAYALITATLDEETPNGS